MSNTVCVVRSANCLPARREHMGSPPGFGGVRFIHLFLVFCAVLLFLLCFVCHGVSCEPDVVSVCGLSSCVLWTRCCQCLWIIHSWLSLLVYLTFIRYMNEKQDYYAYLSEQFQHQRSKIVEQTNKQTKNIAR